MSENHKSGFVNILGNPNVGKSTLMNALVGEKLSIVTSKAQTTRHRIMGIINGEDFQIVFSDTPGILKPVYKLQESMLNFAKSALDDADLIVYVIDVFETPEKNEEFLEKIRNIEIPVFLIINKIDLTTQEKLTELAILWQSQLPKAELFPVSALEKFNIENLMKSIVGKLPFSPPYFPKDQMTDKSERFFVQEIIREKILQNYKKEIPYSVEIEVEEFKESDDIIRIKTLIYVERDTQKGIIIGHKGEALKKTATQARIDLEAFLDKKVYLEIFVKVEKDWRNKKSFLDKFGYNQ
jgi:GTP-binding protein Era